MMIAVYMFLSFNVAVDLKNSLLPSLNTHLFDTANSFRLLSSPLLFDAGKGRSRFAQVQTNHLLTLWPPFRHILLSLPQTIATSFSFNSLMKVLSALFRAFTPIICIRRVFHQFIFLSLVLLSPFRIQPIFFHLCSFLSLNNFAFAESVTPTHDT